MTGAADSTTATVDGRPPCPACGQPARPGARFCRGCGAALTSDPAPPVTPAPVPTPPAPVTGTRLARGGVAAIVARLPRRITRPRWLTRRRQLLLGGVLAVILTVTCGGYYILQNQWYKPDEPVRAMFAALAARDGAAVAQLDRNCGMVCGPGGMAEGYEPPTDLQVLGVDYGAAVADDPTRRPNHSRAGVRVRYRVDGAPHEDVVGVSRAATGWLRPWSVSAGPGGYVQVLSTGLASAKLAGATVKTAKPGPLSGSSGRYFVPPGVYTVSGASSALWSVAPARVVVGADHSGYGARGAQRVELKLSMQPGVVDDIAQQIRQRIDACAAVPAFQPRTAGSSILSDCPFSLTPVYTSTRDPRWTVVDYPQVELQITTDQAVKVHVTKPGHAKITYAYTFQILEPRTWTPAAETVEIKPAGTVTEANGRVVWSG